jgi:hypothetical protein
VTVDLGAAHEFVLREARLLDRLRFAHRFGDGAADDVVRALLAYRNADGGFGNALEPDLRGAASQPVPVEHALTILDQIDRFDAGVVAQACDWLASASIRGGVPFVLPTVEDGPHAPWWTSSGDPSPNPTAGIAGLLHKRAVDHPWVGTATAYCWQALDTELDSLGQDDAINVLRFLEHVPDRERATRVLEALGGRIMRELVALDPAAPGYVKGPLDFAPYPGSPARRLFDDATVDTHLDALAARQQDDGGWPITWEPPSVTAVNEWRGFVTVKALDVLDAYGRLERRKEPR